jgi:hypothetical protein
LVVSDAADAPDWAADLAQSVQRWTGNQTHVVTISMRELRRLCRSGEPILAEWDRELVVIVGSRDVLKAAS